MMPAEDETSTTKQKIGVTAVMEDKWWERNNVATKIDIAAEPEMKRTKSGKMVVVKPKYNRGCGMMTFAIVLRILGIVGGAGTLATGAWIMFKTVTSYVAGSWMETKASYGAMAVFLLIAGVFVIVVECRTKSIMRGCLNTYILVANYLTRGIFCLAIGALMFTSIVQNFPYPPPVGSINIFLYVAIYMLVIGFLNVVYYVFYYCHKRNKHVALAPKYVANAEEIAYGMNLYDPAQRKLEEEKMRKKEEERRAAAIAAGGGTTPIPIRPEFARYASQMEGLDLKWSGKSARPRDVDAPPARDLPPLPAIPTRSSAGGNN